jgi:hypothetical protein
MDGSLDDLLSRLGEAIFKLALDNPSANLDLIHSILNEAGGAVNKALFQVDKESPASIILDSQTNLLYLDPEGFRLVGKDDKKEVYPGAMTIAHMGQFIYWWNHPPQEDLRELMSIEMLAKVLQKYGLA